MSKRPPVFWPALYVIVIAVILAWGCAQVWPVEVTMPKPGSTTGRGYGWQHQQLRDQWARTIRDNGSTQCHATTCLEPSRTIRHGDPWDLGHTDDRTAYTGPEHPRCNRTAGGRKGAEATNARPTPLRHSRVWFPDPVGSH